MWSKLSDLDIDIVNHQSITINNVVYIIGGYKNSRPLEIKKISIFCIESNSELKHLENIPTFKWNSVSQEVDKLDTDEPYDCYGHTVVVWRDMGILFGGCLSTEHCVSALYLFVTRGHYLFPVVLTESDYVWLRVENVKGMLPLSRDGHSVIIYRNKMYLYGGLVNEERRFYYDNKLYELDLLTWEWFVVYNGDFIEPLGRDFCSLVAYNNAIYMYGGRSDDTITEMSHRDVYDSSIWKFELIKRRTNENQSNWTRISPNKGIITGSLLDLNEYFDSNYSENEINLCPMPRRSHMTMLIGNEFLIFGGLYETDSFNIHFNDLWSFNMSNFKWSCLWLDRKQSCPTPLPVRRSSVALLSKNFAIIAGGVTAIASNTINVFRIIGDSAYLPTNSNNFMSSSTVENISSIRKSVTSLSDRKTVLLYQKDSTLFSGSIISLNNINLKPLKSVYMLQPQITLYQIALYQVNKHYSNSKLLNYALPDNVMIDLQLLQIFRGMD